MEICRPRFLERHFKAILSSSRSPRFSFPVFTKARSLKTITPFSIPLSSLQHPFFPASPLRPPSRFCAPILRLLFRHYSIDPENNFSPDSLSQELDWNDHHSQQTVTEEKTYQDYLIEVQQAKQGRFIPVKAYFLCTSIDLRSLQAQNAFNVIPPSSRATNYVVLRYYDFKGDRAVEFDSLNETKCHYMVVFQYGSVVLFNVSEHEADGYLKVVEKHSSGLLSEMRKDVFYRCFYLPNVKSN